MKKVRQTALYLSTGLLILEQYTATLEEIYAFNDVVVVTLKKKKGKKYQVSTKDKACLKELRWKQNKSNDWEYRL